MFLLDAEIRMTGQQFAGSSLLNLLISSAIFPLLQSRKKRSVLVPPI